MNALTPFNFEGRPVRLALDDSGAPWFNAADLAAVLELGNARQALESHVDPEDVQKMDTLTAGGNQLQNHVNESGMYSLVLGSKKEAAKRFRRFVTSQVLPQIRRTGAYRGTAAEPVRQISQAEEQTAALLLIGKTIAELPGTKPGIAMASALEAIHLTTGLNVTPFRKALPPADEAPELTPTSIGEQFGLTAQKVNARLCELGLQVKQPKGGKVPYVLTDAGKEHGELLPFTRGGHAGYSILWRKSVLSLLAQQEAA